MRAAPRRRSSVTDRRRRPARPARGQDGRSGATPLKQVTFEGHADTAVSVAYSPDGKTLASGDGHGKIKLRFARLFRAHTYVAHGLASISVLSIDGFLARRVRLSPQSAPAAQAAATGRLNAA